MVPTAENENPESGTGSEHFDVVIIGGGPGGYASALYGASAGLNIAMIERNKIGGTCLHVGCIPAKALLETATVLRTTDHAKDFGVLAESSGVDLGVTQDRKQGIVDKLAGGLVGLLENRSVTLFDGTGSLDADHRTVQVSGGESGDVAITGDSVILAAGSVPRTIPGFDIDGELVVTSDEVLEIRDLPERAVVIGGGAIGCEFASLLSDLGSKVTVLEALPKILPGLDSDITKVVERSFKKRKVEVRTDVKVTGHTPGESGTSVEFGDGESVDADLVVVSVGRRPYPDLLGLDQTEVSVSDRGFVEVDENCRTSVEGVWAVGDLIATPQLAHIGFAEGMVAIRDILGEDPQPIDYDRVPWCIYCHPEVAFSGLSEDAAKEAGHDVVVAKHRFGGNGRAMIVGEAEGMVKVIAEKNDDGTGGQVLGVHLVGPWATELLGQAYLSVNWEATVAEVAHFIQPHPTLGEAFGETMMSLTGRSLH
ncbi:MAG: dihydrolipoyl dehydrogenase [Acidimicrobiales bacterium]|nr:dihydrolipoyl dehydrogenase [Acidimicrobiales bacterium]